MLHDISEGFHYADSESRPHPAGARVWSRMQSDATCSTCTKQKYWVLDYSITHAGEIQVEDLPWSERPSGIAHLYPPRRVYRERLPAGRVSGAYFMFTGENTNIRQLVDNSRGFAMISDPDGLLLESIRRGARAAAMGNRGYWLFVKAFADALELLENRLTSAETDWHYLLAGQKRTILPLAERILEFLEQHYREHFSLQQLAEHFHCSQSTLTHKFRETYHESIWDRLQKIRIEQSMSMLYRSATLKEIAFESGFVNEFYYSKIFKKVIGCAPGIYRKKMH